MAIFQQLEKLIGIFRRDVQIARSLHTVNKQDDLPIKCAIVGFSYNSPTEEWGIRHYEFVRTRIDSDYSDEELSKYGSNAENVAMVFALCIGYLLGVYQAGDMSDDEFKLAEVQIPGLIMLKLPDITATQA